MDLNLSTIGSVSHCGLFRSLARWSKKTHASLLVNLVVREVARVSSEDREVVHFLAEIKLGCQGMNSVARS